MKTIKAIKAIKAIQIILILAIASALISCSIRPDEATPTVSPADDIPAPTTSPTEPPKEPLRLGHTEIELPILSLVTSEFSIEAYNEIECARTYSEYFGEFTNEFGAPIDYAATKDLIPFVAINGKFTLKLTCDTAKITKCFLYKEKIDDDTVSLEFISDVTGDFRTGTEISSLFENIGDSGTIIAKVVVDLTGAYIEPVNAAEKFSFCCYFGVER